jgi:hypothetical protein
VIAELLDVALMALGLQLLEWRECRTASIRVALGVAGLVAIRAVPVWKRWTGL